jgi:hypothetical protein
MSRALITLNTAADRQRAHHWVEKAPWGTRLEFKAEKRSLPQNDKLWACLTDVATQVEWYGQRLTPVDWKDMFTASLRKARVVPGIDPGSFVLLGLHTSDMSKEEMSNLLEMVAAFGAERGVIFNKRQRDEAA